MNKIIPLIFFITFCTLQKREMQIKGYLKVTASSGLILREGPGTNFSKLNTLPKNVISPIFETVGDTITIKGFKGRWILTEYKGINGYVFSGHVLIAPERESLANENFKRSPITPLLISESGKSIVVKKLINKNSTFLSGNEKPIFRKFSEDQYSNIEILSLGGEYSPKTFIRTLKGSNIIEYPDINNFHPVKTFESGKIIEGKNFLCY